MENVGPRLAHVVENLLTEWSVDPVDQGQTGCPG
jgi:hypothetical protein